MGIKPWLIAACLLVSSPAYAWLPHGAVAPPVVASASATTIAAKLPGGGAISSFACGTVFGTYNIPAVGGGGSSSATAGNAVVAGLTPSTTYYCQAVGGSTYSFQLATSALPVSTPITSLTIGSASEPVPNQISGDTFYNCISNDNVTYTTADDNLGWAGAGTNSALAIGKFTSESPWTGANVNPMPAYGGSGGSFGTDNRSPKLSGLYCLNGNLYGAVGRQQNSTGTGSPTFGVYPQSAGNIIKSTDHGATWANFQAPTVFNANGSIASPPTALMFPSATDFPSLTFAMFGPDDGTLGYRIDNADGYVYVLTASQNWDNGDNVFLARVPRALFANLNVSDYQYYVSGDGTLNAAWSSSIGSAAAIFNNPGKVGYTSISYIPSLNRYLMWEWYYPTATTTSSTVWETYEGPHPWGPWTKIDTTNWITQGFYNAVPLQRTLAGVTANGTPLTVAFSGDYKTCCSAGGFYHFFTANVVVNTH